MTRRPWIPDRRTAIWLGVALYLAGSACLYDAYEHRGGDRPWALRWLPSV